MGNIVVLFAVLLIGAVIGGFCWPYVINSWLIYAGKAAHIAFWQGALLGFVPFIGQLAIPAAVVTWILMMFLM